MRLRCSGRPRGGWPIARAFVLGAIAASLTTGCGRLIGAAAADTLSAAILNQDDPVLVTSGVPAYLLLVDGLIHQRPADPALLAAGAQLFALYGSRFEPDRTRAAELTAKARRYGERAICAAHAPACAWDGLDHPSFVAALERVHRRNIGPLYAYALSWLSHLDATSEDWSAVAELPWVEAAMERVLALDESWDDGGVHGYLGTLNSLRPPAFGGRPDVARAHFERAIELSNGRDLAVQVEYARRYARLMFDQELHDRLLRNVLAASVDAPGLTLFNVLAKREAERLLESGREYF
jgi:hypothetical protein